MVHCVECIREVNKICSSNHAFLVDILNMIGAVQHDLSGLKLACSLLMWCSLV